MNDFTKDELSNLRSCLDVCISDDGEDKPLMDKLKSMIDNYCEHESKIDIGEAPMVCQKCGKVTG